jgi:predicted peptidase
MTQTAHTFEAEVVKSVRLDYLLSLPQGYERGSDEAWPLVLFLHGMGERGTNVEEVKKNGIPRVAEKGNLPFIAVSPQCPPDTLWTDHADALMALLDAIMANYDVDPERVYLTGLSMGGYGCWFLGTLYPERFAAVVPVCGGGIEPHGFPERVCALKDVPVWAFHGAEDRIVPLRASQVLVDTLRECGGDVRFTVYPGVGHDSWTRTYEDPELYEWLLTQNKG